MLRTIDATAFNLIANHPEVRPWLGPATPQDPDGPIDLSATLADVRNFGFMTAEQDGGYIIRREQDGLYSAHTLALPKARGRKMLRLMHDGFDAIFTASNAIEIVTQVPDGNEAASSWAKAAHFRETYRREHAFPLMGELVGTQFYSMHYSEWVLRSRLALELGQAFHMKLEVARGEVSHAPEGLHDRWVGATMGCAIEQNLGKGLGLYNRMAATVGWGQARVLADHPPVVDIGDGIVQLFNGAMDVLQVRRASNFS